MIESLLRSFGLRTGLFTSPHLHSVRERIRLDGEPIDIERFVRVHDDIAPYVGIVDRRSVEAGGPRLSFFEVLTAMAYATFADAPVDVASSRPGMGGTWDATNVADGAVAVVTPVDLDHMEYLGPDVATIAGEKAGIIKDGAVGRARRTRRSRPPRCCCAAASRSDATVAREGVEFGVAAARAPRSAASCSTLQGPAGAYDDVFLPLFGAHQAANAAVALAAVEAFLGGGEPQLNPDLVRAGFADGRARPAGSRSCAAARPSSSTPRTTRTAHGRSPRRSPDGFDFTALVGVVGVLADKDARGAARGARAGARRGRRHRDLVAARHRRRRRSPRSRSRSSAPSAWRSARGSPTPSTSPIERADEAAAELGGGTGVLVTGSVVTAAEARAMLGRGEA